MDTNRVEPGKSCWVVLTYPQGKILDICETKEAAINIVNDYKNSENAKLWDQDYDYEEWTMWKLVTNQEGMK